MPKATAFKLMSKAEQAEYLKSLHKPTPVPRKRVVAAAAGETPPREDLGPKDGLLWLIKKKRLDRFQVAEAHRLRLGFREDGGEVEGIVSCLEVAGGGSGGGGGQELRTVAMTDARRDYLLVVGQVLWGEPQMVAVVDGVCGRGYTLRYLAGGQQAKALELEATLRVALSLVVAWRRAHTAKGGLTNYIKSPDASVIEQKCA